MEFWSTIVGLMRRPKVVIPAFLIALAIGALAHSATSTTYVSSTTMVLTMTEYGGTETEDPTEPTQLINPLLNFNGSLLTTSAILIQTMATGDVREQLGVTNEGTQLIVNDGRTNPELLGLSGPFLYVEASSTSADEASRVVDDAQEVMRQKLREWQRSLNAPEKTYVSLVDVVSPTAPQADSSRATKLGVLGFLCGLLLCMGFAYFGHQLRARRRARMAAAAVDPSLPRPSEVVVQDHLQPIPSSSVRSPEGDAGPDASRTPTKQKPTPKRKPKPHPKPRPQPKRAFVATTPTKAARLNAPDLKTTAGTAVVPVPRKMNGRSRNR